MDKFCDRCDKATEHRPMNMGGTRLQCCRCGQLQKENGMVTKKCVWCHKAFKTPKKWADITYRCEPCEEWRQEDLRTEARNGNI